MRFHRYRGGCHCGNIQLEYHSARAPGEFQPRSCDCSFCRKHDAIYVSDPNGKLTITVRDERALISYRQGSGSAEMLICGRCGVLTAVTYKEDEHLYATVNGKAIEDSEAFGEAVPVSPWKLSAEQKRGRWKGLWFSEVSIHSGRSS